MIYIMSLHISNIEQLLFPITIIIVSMMFGVLLNQIFFGKLRNWLTKQSASIYQIIAQAIKGIPLFISTVIGIYWALEFIPMDAAMTKLLKSLLFIIILIAATMVIARMISGVLSVIIAKSDGMISSTSIFINIVEFCVYILGFLIVLQTFGISITPILTALGVGGLAVALALQDTLSNLFSGVHILLARPIRVNDYIKLCSGEEGFVEDISWRYTVMRTIANNLIIIPNAKIAGAIITNFNKPGSNLGIIIPVGVSYDSDLDKVEHVTKEVAAEVLTELYNEVIAEPLVRFHTFNDFSIDFNVILQTDEFANQYILKHTFIKKLHVAYKREGIEIPFPVRTVQMKS